MAIPTYDTLMLPILKNAADGQEHHLHAINQLMIEQFNLTEEEQQELLPSKKQTVILNRTGWAITYLVKAGLLERSRRGFTRITKRGRNVLAENPPHIDRQYLLQWDEFKEFQTIKGSQDSDEQIKTISTSQDETEQTPEEIIDSVYQSLRAKLADELLEVVLDSTPAFFEHLVVDLLLSMGYGGSLGIGKAIGRTADGGIDGFINEDKLGLDTIYIQAKRYDPSNSVGRPAVQAFVGSLMGYGATRGVFITTSSFSQHAIDYVERLPNAKVILIDGDRLMRLMIEHNVGVSVEQTYLIKKVDNDYFNVD